MKTESEISEIIARGAAYERLTSYPEWELLVEDITRQIDERAKAVIFDLVNPRFEDRAICWGLRKVLDHPVVAITEAEGYKARKENEEQ